MIVVDKDGFIKASPDDVINNAEQFVIIENNRVFLQPKWGSVKFVPKRFISYVNDFMTKYYHNPTEEFTWKIILFLFLATSRCYSALSKFYSRKKKNFKSVFYLEDLFHTVIMFYLEFLQEYSQEEIFTYTDNSSKLESKVISHYLRFLENYCYERSFGDDELMESFVHDMKGDDSDEVV